MKSGLIRAYQDTFSQEEIDGMLDFYRTPTGQAMIDKAPLVQKKKEEVEQGMAQALALKMLDHLSQMASGLEQKDSSKSNQ